VTDTTTNTAGPFAAGLRGLTIAGVTLIAVQAFEAVAVSTAMPTVAAALHGLSLYALAFGMPAATGIVGMVWAGMWSDRRGPVGPLAAGWLLFVAGLVIAGAAGSMGVLVAGRGVQGLGAGLNAVALYVVVARAYPEALRPRVFSLFAAAWVLPALVGPAIAGLLVTHAGWRWVFLSVPFVALAAAIVGWRPTRQLPGPPTDGTGSDPASVPAAARVAVALVAGVAASLLSVAGHYRLAVAIPLTVLAVALLVWSVPRLLPSGTYRSGRGLPTVVLLRGLVSGAFTGAEVFLPLLLSRERGLSPGQAGLVLTVGALGWSAGSALQGRISSAQRRPALLRLGFGLLTLGILLVATTVWRMVPLVAVYPSWVMAGVGIGIAFPTLAVLTLELSAPAEEGRNSSALQVNDALLQAITLAVSGTIFAALVDNSHWAPYAAGFAVAAGAAAVGTALARRVRPCRSATAG
jgi:MFS family permease